MTTDKPGQVYALIPQAMAEIGAVAKGQRNEYDRYDYRGIDDIYNHFHGPLSSLGLTIVPHEVKTVATREVKTAKGGTQLETTMVVVYRIYGPDGSYVQAEAEGVGMDRGDKASNKAQTAAFKVLCFQCFLPPLEDGSDSERESPERAEPARGNPVNEAKRVLYDWTKAYRDESDLRPDASSDADFLRAVGRAMYGGDGPQAVVDCDKMKEAIRVGLYDLNDGKSTEGGK